MRHRDADDEDGALCMCGHPRGDHRGGGEAPTHCDPTESPPCRCLKFRPRIFGTTRQLTGAPYIHHAYVCDGNKVVMACTHRHGARRSLDPISGEVKNQGAPAARACAERMLREYLRRRSRDQGQERKTPAQSDRAVK